jgi:hypothetical protein
MTSSTYRSFYAGPHLSRTYFLALPCSDPPTPSTCSGVSLSVFACNGNSHHHLTQTTNQLRYTLSRSAPASINLTATSAWADSMAKCSGVLPNTINKRYTKEKRKERTYAISYIYTRLGRSFTLTYQQRNKAHGTSRRRAMSVRKVRRGTEQKHNRGGSYSGT